MPNFREWYETQKELRHDPDLRQRRKELDRKHTDRQRRMQVDNLLESGKVGLKAGLLAGIAGFGAGALRHKPTNITPGAKGAAKRLLSRAKKGAGHGAIGAGLGLGLGAVGADLYHLPKRLGKALALEREYADSRRALSDKARENVRKRSGK